jgi:hypothetical protein
MTADVLRTGDDRAQEESRAMSLFGRDELAWDVMAAAGEAFLVERARLARLIS